MNYLNSLYQQVLLSIPVVLSDCGKQVKVGRPPKVSDLQLACLYVLSAKILIDPSIQSYHLFRKYRTTRVYKLLELYRRRMNLIILILSILFGKEVKLTVDGTILRVANIYRAQTRKIKRVAGKKFWVKRKRNIYSWDYQRNVRFEEVHYGLLVMIVCDRNGIVYDLWVHPASYHEVKSVRIRYQKSLWFRALADSFCLMGDRGYRGLEYVHVCEDKPDKSVRQVVEAVNSQIKVFNGVSRWRNITTLLAYLQGYAVGYSFFRKSWLFK
jgi:hypothetical protein